MRLGDGFKGIDFSGFGANSSADYADAMSDVFGIPSAVAYSPLNLSPVPSLSPVDSTSTIVPFSTPSVSSQIVAPSIPFFDYVSPVTQQSAPLGPYSPSKIKNADILPDDSGNFASTASPTSTRLKIGPGKTTAYPVPDPGSDIIGSISKTLYSALSIPSGADMGLSITPPPATTRSKFGVSTSTDNYSVRDWGKNPAYIENKGLSVDITQWPKQIVAKVDDAYKAVVGVLSPTPPRTQLPTSPTPSVVSQRILKNVPQDNSIGGTVKTVFDSLLSVLTPIAAAKQAKAGQRAASATSRVGTQQGSGGSDMSTYLLIGGGVLAAGILVYVATKD